MVDNGDVSTEMDEATQDTMLRQGYGLEVLEVFIISKAVELQAR